MDGDPNSKLQMHVAWVLIQARPISSGWVLKGSWVIGWEEPISGITWENLREEKDRTKVKWCLGISIAWVELNGSIYWDDHLGKNLKVGVPRSKIQTHSMKHWIPLLIVKPIDGLPLAGKTSIIKMPYKWRFWRQEFSKMFSIAIMLSSNLVNGSNKI